MAKTIWIILVLALAGCGDPGQKPAANAEPVEPEAAAQAVEPTAEKSEMEVDLEDAGLTAAVKGRLAADPRVSALNINVDTQNGIVSLKGNVQDAPAKAAAEEIARTTEGVGDVVNVITIGPVRAQGGT